MMKKNSERNVFNTTLKKLRKQKNHQIRLIDFKEKYTIVACTSIT